MKRLSIEDYPEVFVIDSTSRSGLVWNDVPDHILTGRDWSKRSWKTKFVGKPVGEINVKGYWIYRSRVANQQLLLHRVIYEMLNGPIPKDFEIDHIDMVRSNNTVSNLRLATGTQNRYNRKAQKGKISQFKGVSPNGRGWRARVTLAKKIIFCKTFATEEEAHAAYCAAAETLHKEFFRKA